MAKGVYGVEIKKIRKAAREFNRLGYSEIDIKLTGEALARALVNAVDEAREIDAGVVEEFSDHLVDVYNTLVEAEEGSFDEEAESVAGSSVGDEVEGVVGGVQFDQPDPGQKASQVKSESRSEARLFLIRKVEEGKYTSKQLREMLQQLGVKPSTASTYLSDLRSPKYTFDSQKRVAVVDKKTKVVQFK